MFKKAKVIPQGLFPEGSPDVDWNNADNIYAKKLNGEKISVKSILQGQKTVLIFLRKFDCTTCYSYAILFSHLKPVLSLANVRIVFFTCHSDLREIKIFIETFGFWLRKISMDKLIQPLPGELYLDPDRNVYKFFGLCSQIKLSSALKVYYNLVFSRVFKRLPKSNGGKNVAFYKLTEYISKRVNWVKHPDSGPDNPVWQSPGICVVNNNQLVYRYVCIDQTKIIPEDIDKFFDDAFGIIDHNIIPGNDLDSLLSGFMETAENKSEAAFVDESEIVLEKVIGEGLESKVVKGQWLGHQVAIKFFKHGNMEGNMDNSKNFANETAILMSLGHNNLIKFLGFGFQEESFMIIMQFMPLGSLFDVLGLDIEMDATLKHQFVSDIVEGMLYLHTGNPPIVHADIKSLNILVDEDGTVKISDFGFARDFQIFDPEDKQDDYTGGGTIQWSSPELLSKKSKATMESDVFAFGVVLWEIATRRRPWKSIKRNIIIESVLKGERPEIRSETDNWNSKFDNLLQQCWHQDPKKRPKFKAILKSLKNVEIPI